MMRKILLSVLILGGGLFASQADAASPCKSGPPAWWNAPRVSYTHSGGYASRSHSHTFSAQRRSPSYGSSPSRYRYRDSYRGW